MRDSSAHVLSAGTPLYPDGRWYCSTTGVTEVRWQGYGQEVIVETPLYDAEDWTVRCEPRGAPEEDREDEAITLVDDASYTEALDAAKQHMDSVAASNFDDERRDDLDAIGLERAA